MPTDNIFVLVVVAGLALGARAPRSFFDKIGLWAMGLGLVVASVSAFSLPFCVNGGFCGLEDAIPVAKAIARNGALLLIPVVVSLVLVVPRPAWAEMWPWAVGLSLVSIAVAILGGCVILAVIAAGVPLLLGGLGVGTSFRRSPMGGLFGRPLSDDPKHAVAQWFSAMGLRFLVFFGVEFVALVLAGLYCSP